MFAESLLDSSLETRSRRGWLTLFTFAAQTLAIGALLLLPLIYTQALPALQKFVSLSALLAPPPAPPAPTHLRASSGLQSNYVNGVIVVPRSIPAQVAQVDDQGIPPAVEMNGIEGGTREGWSTNSVLNSIGAEVARLVSPPLAPSVARQVVTSRMMEGNLIRRVQPEYPSIARMARIQGSVVLHAIISKEGAIENLQIVHGHPMLVKAAMDAVRHWRYRPHILNDSPIEVETEVTVNFILAPG